MKLFSTVLPALAVMYLPLLMAEIDAHWPEFVDPAVMAGQVEAETCPSLTSPKCWNPRTELKTSREYGFGLGQITIAYSSDGKERFNTFREIKSYHASLASWAWKDRYDPQLQLRALVLKNRVNWNAIRFANSDRDRAAMMVYAYNGGLGAVLSDRRRCEKTPGCDPGTWFGNLETTSTKSNKSLGQAYGNRSPHTISREYVKSVMTFRAERYREHIHDVRGR